MEFFYAFILLRSPLEASFYFQKCSIQNTRSNFYIKSVWCCFLKQYFHWEFFLNITYRKRKVFFFILCVLSVHKLTNVYDTKCRFKSNNKAQMADPFFYRLSWEKNHFTLFTNRDICYLQHSQYSRCTFFTNFIVSIHSCLGTRPFSIAGGESPKRTFKQPRADKAVELRLYPPSSAIAILPLLMDFSICVIWAYPAGVTLHCPIGSSIAASKPAETIKISAK